MVVEQQSAALTSRSTHIAILSIAWYGMIHTLTLHSTTKTLEAFDASVEWAATGQFEGVCVCMCVCVCVCMCVCVLENGCILTNSCVILE